MDERERLEDDRAPRQREHAPIFASWKSRPRVVVHIPVKPEGKVAVLVTRGHMPGSELLVFHHDRSGNQVPAGTMEAGEDPLLAAARELREESGLDIPALTFLDSFVDPHASGVYTATDVHASPSRTAPVIGRADRGLAVVVEERDEWVRVRMDDGDWDHDPPLVLSSVEGWVDGATVCTGLVRHLFHGRAPEDAPDRWNLWVSDGGGCEFRFFWVPLERRPTTLIPYHADWVERMWDRLVATM